MLFDNMNKINFKILYNKTMFEKSMIRAWIESYNYLLNTQNEIKE